MNRAKLATIARDPKRPHLTRQAAREALAALDRVDIRLALDAGAPTHERAAGDDRVVVLGPAPAPEKTTTNHTATASACGSRRTACAPRRSASERFSK